MNCTINCNGQLVDFKEPKIMGILNLTPDSFYDGGKYTTIAYAMDQVGKMVQAGVDIIDIGGMSSRPGADIITSQEECNRIIPVIESIRQKYSTTLLSVDTIYGRTVQKVAEIGVHLINDISAGLMDPSMIDQVAASGLPYILMHMKGQPNTMQKAAKYHDVAYEVSIFLKDKIRELQSKGIKDIVLDPGFGFGKTIHHNFTLLREMESMHWLGCPLLVGLSRKSMIYKTLNITPSDALNGTTALHMAALMKGANILRVHDVKEAVEVRKLFMQMHQH